MLAEIGNLKNIISRSSEFSKMPLPQFESVDLNEIVRKVARLFQAQFDAPGQASIKCRLELADSPVSIAGDPELLYRALSNLVLNAMDAMPGGGTLTLRTKWEGDDACVEVSDTGSATAICELAGQALDRMPAFHPSADPERGPRNA